jgi:anti-anti-sigma regulatory factor
MSLDHARRVDGVEEMTGNHFEVTVLRADQVHAELQAQGRLDLSTVDRLTAVLETLLSWQRRHVRLDLAGVTVADPHCLRPLVRVHDMFLAEHGLLVLTSVSPNLARTLRKDRMGRNLFFTDEPQASSSPDGFDERTVLAARSPL